MIVITGAAGFIGSCVAKYFSAQQMQEIVLVDDFTNSIKDKNTADLINVLKIERDRFFSWAIDKPITHVVHLGARTDTVESDYEIFRVLNFEYSKSMWELCVAKKATLIYASSAATYGDGLFGYEDSHQVVDQLKPLNAYGRSKNDFDKWVIKQESRPKHWYGLKFFNVYGPNEYHKGRMASVVFHAFNQIQATGKLKLFRSHNPKFADGGQMRDFIYVKDIVQVISYLLRSMAEDGIYNLGSGKARTFNDLASAVFSALNLPKEIEFIDTPTDIREAYQYFTEAKMEKLLDIGGYQQAFSSLESGIQDYVSQYLLKGEYY